MKRIEVNDGNRGGIRIVVLMHGELVQLRDQHQEIPTKLSQPEHAMVVRSMKPRLKRTPIEPFNTNIAQCEVLVRVSKV